MRSCIAHICCSVLIHSILSGFSLMGLAGCHLPRSGPQRVPPPTTPTPHSSHTQISLALVSVCFSYHQLTTWCVIFILSASPSVCAVVFFFFLMGEHCWGVSDARAGFSLSAVVLFTEYTVYCGRTPRHLPLMTSVSALCGANGPASEGVGVGADWGGGHRARRGGEGRKRGK